MDSDETEDERNRKNIVPHPQTVRRRNRTLDSALDTEILLLESEMSWDSTDLIADWKNPANTNISNCIAETPSFEDSSIFERDSLVETHMIPVSTSPLLNTAHNDYKDFLPRHEKLYSILLSSNSSISSTSSSSSEDEDCEDVNYGQDRIPTENSDSSDSSSDEDITESYEMLSEPHVNTRNFNHCENFNVKPVQEYFSNDKEIMFKEAQLKICDVMLMILSYSVRFSLSYKARRGLIEMTKAFAGSEFSQWDISDYYLSKIFDPPDSVIVYNFWCPVCCVLLEQPTTKKNFKTHNCVCDKCSQQFKLSMNSPNYFISIDLKYQITALLSTDTIREALFENLNYIKSMKDNGTIRDVYDSLLYKQFLSSMKSSTSNLLSLTFNTDGAALFHSSKQSFWPILGILNELPPHLRFRYPLLAGLWVGKNELSPNEMNLFLKSFVEQCKYLSINGFSWEDEKTGDISYFILKAFICIVDTIARAIVQNRLQHNAYYGCSWCFIFGKYCGGCVRFLMEKKESRDRTHLEHLKHMIQAMKKIENNRSKKKGKEVKGVKGYSVLTELDNIDMVWSFPRDYLHADLIGAVSHMWGIWTNPKSPIRLTKDQVNEVNNRLVKMTPPQEIHRLVRSITCERSKWKASEWQSWMLFYSIPCLYGILDDCALMHFALYVNSMHTLLQQSITQNEMEQVDRDLNLFAAMFEVLYGEEFVKFCIHTLKHVVECVKTSGPIWAISTFPFENAIFYLKQCVHGPKGVYQQMAKKTLQANVCQCIVEEVSNENTCKDYCRSLFSRNEVSSFYRTASGNIVLLGNGSHDLKYDILSQTGSKVLTFQRCIFKGMVINSVFYERAIKSDNTTFFLENGKFVQVLNILLCDENAYVEIVNFQVETMVLSSTNKSCIFQTLDMNNVVCKTLVKVQKRLSTDIIPVSFLKEKCVVIRVEKDIYISKLPRTLEIQ